MANLIIHNLSEDIVKHEIDKYCAEIENSGQTKDICTCEQCRLDAACYVLNRVKPRYLVSNRGAAREGMRTIAREQEQIDISVLVYQGLQQVSHNQRPYFSHSGRDKTVEASGGTAIFVVPMITGRIYSGKNFEPVSSADLEMRMDGKLVSMRDFNWQNPYTLTPDTEGAFSFWPSPVPAKGQELKTVFSFSLHIKSAGFEPYGQFFTIPVTSEPASPVTLTMERTHRLEDIYIFPEGSDGS
jgi:competence protein ComFB